MQFHSVAFFLSSYRKKFEKFRFNRRRSSHQFETNFDPPFIKRVQSIGAQLNDNNLFNLIIHQWIFDSSGSVNFGWHFGKLIELIEHMKPIASESDANESTKSIQFVEIMR